MCDVDGPNKYGKQDSAVYKKNKYHIHKRLWNRMKKEPSKE